MGKIIYDEDAIKEEIAHELMIVDAYAEDHPEWDATFVNSLQEFFLARGFLTDKQHTALQNVVEKWRIVSWYEENYG